MSNLTLPPALSTQAMTLRNALAGLGTVVQLRPETNALIESGLRVQSMLDAIAPDLEIAAVLEVDSPDMLLEAEQLNGRIKSLCADTGAIERERKALTAPFLDMTRILNTGYNELRDDLTDRSDKLSGKIMVYAAEQRRIAREREAAEEQVRQEAAAAARKAEAEAQEAARKKLAEAQAAQQAGDAEKAQELATQAAEQADAGRQAAQVAQAAYFTRPIAAPPSKPKGLRETWSAAVVDLEALILHVADRIRGGDKSLIGLLEANQSALNAKAKVEKTGFNLPGVRADMGQSISVRKVAVEA